MGLRKMVVEVVKLVLKAEAQRQGNALEARLDRLAGRLEHRLDAVVDKLEERLLAELGADSSDEAEAAPGPVLEDHDEDDGGLPPA